MDIVKLHDGCQNMVLILETIQDKRWPNVADVTKSAGLVQ
jgi:hypothetical protein